MKKSKWTLVTKDLPDHKDLVICVADGISQPAIFYNNFSFSGFWHFTTFYINERRTGVYAKVRLKNKWKIENVTKWQPFPEP